MKFICKHCGSKYIIADEKVRNRTLKIRCKKCNNIIEVRDPSFEKSFTPRADGGSKTSKRQSVLERKFAESFRSGKKQKDQGTHGLYSAVKRSAEALEQQETNRVQWFVMINNSPRGPMSARKIRAHEQAGRVTDGSFVWKEGMADWVTMRNCKDLIRLLANLAIEDELTTSRVFISYSHDSDGHKQRILDLAQKLRREGINAWIDQFEDPPVEGWPRWMRDQLQEATFVLVVCTEKYKRRFEGREKEGIGRGGNWEGFITEAMLYHDDARNHRFIPIIFDDDSEQNIPLVLRTTTHYRLPDVYHGLLRRLSNQPAVKPVPLGPLEQMSQVSTETDSELTALREAQKNLLIDGKDTKEIEKRILIRRRQLRDTDDIGVGCRLSDNRYEIIERIGSGGFATVWKAYDTKYNRVVAVKTLHQQYREDKTRCERFFRGARKMASLKHPQIVKVLDDECREGMIFYFVMEYVSGGDLDKLVRSGKDISGQVVTLIRDIANALYYAHQNGLVHRDIKPANILLDDQGRPKLTDFDLVRAVDTTGGTRTGALGTYMYASPEALEDASRADARSDQFSLGMVGVFLVSGEKLPIEAYRDPQTFIRQLNCSERLQEVLARACEWDLNKRFNSVSDMDTALSIVSEKVIKEQQAMSRLLRALR